MREDTKYLSYSFFGSCANDNLYFLALKSTCPARIKVTKSPWGKRIFLGNVFPGIYLTEREVELVRLLEQYKYREIAKIMKVSHRTVEYCSANIRAKLGCRNKRRLVDVLKQLGLLEQLSIAIDINYLFSDVNDH